MRLEIALSRPVVDWALNRAGKDPEEARERFPLDEWVSGEAGPTLKQLEAFANYAYVPVGYLFLARPPEEPTPIPDLRTVGDAGTRSPGADLLDVIYLSQRRQEWYRRRAVAIGEPQVDLIGSQALTDEPMEAASRLRERLRFEMNDRSGIGSRYEAVTVLSQRLEDAGVLVMISGVVGNNNTRVLDPNEFRGFSMADDYAPLIFVNGVDSKAAQLFTLAHETAHLSHGGSGITDASAGHSPDQSAERWCNQVAAEFLVPIDDLRAVYRRDLAPMDEVRRLSRRYHASTLVVLRRVFDAGYVDWAAFRREYVAEDARLSAAVSTSTGGNFYNTGPVRWSKRFARALLADTLEGGTTYREAGRLLALRKTATLDEVGRQLGVL